ncbi:MFS transporter [Clostridium thermarum]|uniref:MFS transporter n=1 Tax=Clostridium thermarum TaxID=1716543 RepID=UPI00111E17F1|nr:MFS transporter [Clostridium thermarum]
MINRLQAAFKKNIIIDNNLKFYILNGILFTFMATFSRSYGVKFLYRLGGNEFHVSLFNALPGFVALFSTIPGLLWINHSNNKRRTIGNFFIWSRFIILSFVIITFLPADTQPMAFVLVYGLMNFPDSISVTALQSYSGDIFRPKHRTKAISLRNKFSTLAQLIAFLILGQILGNKYLDNSIVIFRYKIFFIIAFLIGIVEIFTFYKLREVNSTVVKTNINLKETLRKAIANKNYIIFLLCSSAFHFSWQMGWPLFNIYQIDVLGADEKWLMVINIASSLVMFFSYNYWSKLITKRGNNFAIFIATIGMALTPMLFTLCYNLTLMTLMQIVSGFFTAGTTTAILTSLLEASPDEDRIIYVGIHATCTNITLSISPLVSNLVLNNVGIINALIITGLLRFIASTTFILRRKMVR